MLDERKTAILSAVVQEYIATALPVGSTHIADAPGCGCRRRRCATRWRCSSRRATSSSRTRRPGGSRPTRATASSSTTSPPRAGSTSTPRPRVGEFFATAHGRLEEMLHRTTDLLARLTNYAAVVVGPKAEAVAVRSVQVVALSSTAATVVAVLGNGAVESETIEIAADARPTTRSRRPARALDAQCSGAARRGGRADADRRRRPSTGVRRGARRRSSQGRRREHVYMGGTSAMASAFDAVDIVARRAAHARAAVRRRVAGVRHRRPRHVGGHRRRARRAAACRRARWSSPRSSSTASTAGRSACSARRG